MTDKLIESTIELINVQPRQKTVAQQIKQKINKTAKEINDGRELGIFCVSAVGKRCLRLASGSAAANPSILFNHLFNQITDYARGQSSANANANAIAHAGKSETRPGHQPAHQTRNTHRIVADFRQQSGTASLLAAPTNSLLINKAWPFFPAPKDI